MTLKMRNPGWLPGARETGHAAKLTVCEHKEQAPARQEFLVAIIEKNSRERFEITLCRRADGSVRTELRVRQQNGERNWKAQSRTISIDPELAATEIAEGFVKARHILNTGEFARDLTLSVFSDARARGAR